MQITWIRRSAVENSELFGPRIDRPVQCLAGAGHVDPLFCVLDNKGESQMKLLQTLGRISVLMAMFSLTAGTLIGCADTADDTASAGSTESGGVDTP